MNDTISKGDNVYIRNAAGGFMSTNDRTGEPTQFRVRETDPVLGASIKRDSKDLARWYPLDILVRA